MHRAADDSSHQRAKVKERDGFVDGALEAAGVRVVRVKWGRGYDLEKVAGVLWESIGQLSHEALNKSRPQEGD